MTKIKPTIDECIRRLSQGSERRLSIKKIKEIAAEGRTNPNCEILTLRSEARKAFVDALLNPPSPNEAAQAAAAWYKKQLKD